MSLGKKGSHSIAGEQGDRGREKARPDHRGNWRPGSNSGSHSSKTEPLDRSMQVLKGSLGHTEGRDACARLGTSWLNLHAGASDAGAMRWGPVSSRNETCSSKRDREEMVTVGNTAVVLQRNAALGHCSQSPQSQWTPRAPKLQKEEVKS